MKRHVVLAVLLASGVVAAQASAQWGSWLTSYINENIPQLSPHSPASFSLPIPGAGGYGALSSSLERLTPNRPARPAPPLWMRNPYVTWPWPGRPAPERSMPAALMIKNPYVAGSGATPPPPAAPALQ
jgi:hypothetical protein